MCRKKREEKGEKRENHRKLESLHISGSQTGGMVEKRVRPFLKAQRDSREEQKGKKEKAN